MTTLTYVGDVQDVEDHIRKLTKNGNFSDLCKIDRFDAIASLRNELFIFVDEVRRVVYNADSCHSRRKRRPWSFLDFSTCGGTMGAAR